MATAAGPSVRTPARRSVVAFAAGLVTVGAWVGAAFGQVPAAAPAAAKPASSPPSGPLRRPHFVYQADKGFIDDPLALAPEAGLAALLRTDSASFARVEILDLNASRGLRSFAVGDAQQIFERVVFTDADGALAVITRNPTTGKRTAQRFSAEGEARGLIGPHSDFGFAERSGKRLLVGWDRTRDDRAAAKGKAGYAVAVYDLASGTRVGKPYPVVTEAGMLKRPAVMRFVSWADGYTRVVAQKIGQFDKQRDMRMPDRAAVLDVLSGSFAWEADIGDVVAWATFMNLRKSRPNRSLFAAVTPDHAALELVDTLGGHAPVALAQAFEMYDPRSLVEVEVPFEHRLYFSLALDPMNPEALARRKADRPYLDLYEVSLPPEGPPTPAATRATARHVLRAPLGDRPVGWLAAGHWVLLLTKHKSFSRGGTELAVYKTE